MNYDFIQSNTNNKIITDQVHCILLTVVNCMPVYDNNFKMVIQLHKYYIIMFSVQT